MKLMDKIKNALFEEEYVEIEEKPKKQKQKKQKKKIEPFQEMDEVVEEPIAKRIIPPEKKVEVETPSVAVKRETVSKPVITNYDDDIDVNSNKEEKTFPMVSDEDLRPDYIERDVRKSVQPVQVEQPVYSTYKDISITEVSVEKVESKPYQAGKKNDGYLDNYTVHEYGSKAKEKSYFKPSPVISPVFGIIEEKEKKEEYRPPREVRLSSAFHDKINVDDVRKKAFGGLADDIDEFSEPVSEVQISSIDVDDDNLLVDLRDDKSVVEVEKLTVGDAVEYFEDLGLEYNNDYIDVSKEKANGRRVKSDKEYEEIPDKALNKEEEDGGKPTFLKEKEVKKEKTDEENLFDLIDSMYDK